MHLAPSSDRLTLAQRETIINSWEQVKPKQEKFSKLFYHRLFDVAPDLIPVFRMASNMSTKISIITSCIVDLSKQGTFLIFLKLLLIDFRKLQRNSQEILGNGSPTSSLQYY